MVYGACIFPSIARDDPNGIGTVPRPGYDILPRRSTTQGRSLAVDQGQKTQAHRIKEAQLAGLYEEYYDRLARYAYAHIGHKASAEDIAGEVFVKALAALDRYQDKGVPMQAWLFTIARNLITDHQRNAGKYRQTSLEGLQIEYSRDLAADVETKADIERLGAAMRQLTSDQREVVRLRFLAGLTSAEVGKVMHKKDGAVREMQRAALEKLRRLMGSNDQRASDEEIGRIQHYPR